MKLNDAARALIGRGVPTRPWSPSTPDGSPPQATLVWIALQSTPDGDELVTAHLSEHKKVRNVRRDPRVAVTILSPPTVSVRRCGPIWRSPGPRASSRAGAPELLKELAQTLSNPPDVFPPADAPPGYLTRIRIDKVGGIGPWAS